MPLKCLILEIPSGLADGISDALLEEGAQAVSVEDANAGTPQERAIYGEPGTADGQVWTESTVRVLLDRDADEARFVELAANACGPDWGARSYRVEKVEDDDWVRASQAQFGPVEAAPGIWIVPSWHEPVEADALNIRIDPGLAFGTGTHPTTQLCLRWLSRRITPGCSFLDYGCGSGILAIAAARLGAGRVCGIDVDPDALAAAADNARRNGVDVSLQSASERPEDTFDFAAANILANPLRVLAPALARAVLPGGQIALSGILESQAGELLRVYQPYFDMRAFAVQDSWVCLEGSRR